MQASFRKCKEILTNPSLVGDASMLWVMLPCNGECRHELRDVGIGWGL